MVTSTPLLSLHVDVACGSALCDSEEGREFWQRRLAFFGQVGLALCVALYLLLNLFWTLGGHQPWTWWVSRASNQIHLGCCLVFLVVYLVCRVRRPLGRLVLSLVDAGSIVLVAAAIGLLYNADGMTRFSDYHGIMSITVTLFIRAVIVPSSVRQTIVTSSLAVVPVLVGYYTALEARGIVVPPPEQLNPVAAAGLSAPLATTVLGAWCAIVVAASTVASRVIYGLREEAREAQQLGQYTLEGRLGKGGMGEVYKASHVLLRRPTAVKILRPEQAGEKSIARFEREVQLTSRLTHPNTIAIYDYGRTPENLFYYAMEYLEGVTLEELVRKDGAQPPARVLHILAQACGSLAEAHRTGLIHRDIKPANIFLCERGGTHDVVKVLDFGLVKNIDQPDDSSISVANTIKGSPLYMSPESIRTPDELDVRSDIYSLGAVAYYLVTGKPLFDSKNFLEICSLHLQTVPEKPSARGGRSVPEDLEGLVMRCLEKNPDARPANARELHEALRACADFGTWTERDAASWWKEHPDVITPPEEVDESPIPVATTEKLSSAATRTALTTGFR